MHSAPPPAQQLHWTEEVPPLPPPPPPNSQQHPPLDLEPIQRPKKKRNLLRKLNSNKTAPSSAATSVYSRSDNLYPAVVVDVMKLLVVLSLRCSIYYIALLLAGPRATLWTLAATTGAQGTLAWSPSETAKSSGPTREASDA